jgi:hypothetical protein
MSEHILRLKGAGARGRRVSGPLLRDALDALVDGLRHSVRLGVDGRSSSQGPAPAWLEQATAFDVVEIRKGSTEIVLQARSLAESAPDKFRQIEMFSAVDPSDCCFDVLGASLADALAERRDSDRYDDQLVGGLESFGRVLRHGVEVVELEAGGTHRIDPLALETFRRLRREMPEDRRVVVAGKLDLLRHSDLVFTIVLDSGATVRGVVAGDDVDLGVLASLWGQPARVSGTAKFRPSGSVLRIDADRVEPADGDGAVFSRMPMPLLRTLDVRALRRPQGPRSGVNAIIGEWPGDESEEEVLAALGDLG